MINFALLSVFQFRPYLSYIKQGIEVLGNSGGDSGGDSHNGSGNDIGWVKVVFIFF